MSQENPKVSVILLGYNHWDLTKQCLESLAKTTPLNVEIIVVDNGSSDEAVEMLKPFGCSLFGDSFRRIRLEKNRNIAPAINVGARVARGEFLFLLNNDTIAQPNWLPPLLQAFEEDDKLGGVGPLLMYPDQTVQHLGVAFCPSDQLLLAHLYAHLPCSHRVVSRTRHYQALTGAAFFTPTSLFLQEGLWDENFINGLEDIDFCLRLGQKGYHFSCIPESQFFHLGTQTIGNQKDFSHEQNLLRFWQKWGHIACIDLPDLLAVDGYSLRITTDLNLKVSVSPEISKQYFHQLNPFNGELCLSCLQDEPLWIDGYSMIGELFEQIDSMQAALQMYQDAVIYSLSYDIEDHKRLKRVKQALGEDISFHDECLDALYQSILDEQNYERKRSSIMKKLANGTPPQRALLPQYEQAGKEAQKLRQKLIKIGF